MSDGTGVRPHESAMAVVMSKTEHCPSRVTHPEPKTNGRLVTSDIKTPALKVSYSTVRGSFPLFFPRHRSIPDIQRKYGNKNIDISRGTFNVPDHSKNKFYDREDIFRWQLIGKNTHHLRVLQSFGNHFHKTIDSPFLDSVLKSNLAFGPRKKTPHPHFEVARPDQPNPELGIY